MPTSAFTIKLGEGVKRVSLDVLTEALQNALEILQNVSQDFTSGAVRWEVVKASLKSPLMLAFAPSSQNNGKLPPAVGRRIVAACAGGFDELEREAILPPHFNEEALLAADRLMKVAQKEGAKLAVGAGRRPEVTPTTRAVEHIRQVVDKARMYIDYGTIEGSLDEISVRGGLHFAVWEALTNHRIECAATPERLEEAKALLGRRVAVSGRVRYRNRKPTSIRVEAIKTLREASELPQLEDMPAIDITGGLNSEEYVRRMRDAQ